MNEHHHIARPPSNLNVVGQRFFNGLQIGSLRGNLGWRRPVRCIVKRVYVTRFIPLFFTVQPATHLLRPVPPASIVDGAPSRPCLLASATSCTMSHDVNCSVTGRLQPQPTGAVSQVNEKRKQGGGQREGGHVQAQTPMQGRVHSTYLIGIVGSS